MNTEVFVTVLIIFSAGCYLGCIATVARLLFNGHKKNETGQCPFLIKAFVGANVISFFSVILMLWIYIFSLTQLMFLLAGVTAPLILWKKFTVVRSGRYDSKY